MIPKLIYYTIYSMISLNDLKDYIALNQVFGSSIDWVQGPGGNISVKSDNNIIIKQSGTFLSETDEKSGYVVCSIPILLEHLQHNDDNTSKAVLQGNGVPSMESFFHLLPARICVHIHPTHSLYLLVQEENKDFPSCLTIPYIKPGIELAKYIFSQYKGEHCIFLKNHGVILLGHTVQDILDKLQYIDPYNMIKDKRLALPLLTEFLNVIKETTGRSYFFQHVRTEKDDIINVKSFVPFTPDIVLFLKDAPFICKEDEIKKDLVDYENKYRCMPSVIICHTTVYVCAENWKKTLSVQSILRSYLDFVSNYEGYMSILSEDNIKELHDDTKEKYRLNLK